MVNSRLAVATRCGGEILPTTEPSTARDLHSFSNTSELSVGSAYRRFIILDFFTVDRFVEKTMSNPVSPSLKDLPKVSVDLKSQLEGFNHDCMKKAETAIKNVLPSAEDVRQERQHSDLIHGLEHFQTGKLKHADTKEKIILPNATDVAAEKNQQTLIAGIEKFDPAKLKHTETQEKNPLPDKTAIEQEKGKQEFISGIENFDPAKLKHAETMEKNVLPTKETIDAEKVEA